MSPEPHTPERPSRRLWIELGEADVNAMRARPDTPESGELGEVTVLRRVPGGGALFAQSMGVHVGAVAVLDDGAVVWSGPRFVDLSDEELTLFEDRLHRLGAALKAERGRRKQ